MTGGAIALYALIAAAVAATAVTAAKAATGGVDDLNDAAGEWFKTLFISFAANSVGGAAGAAGEAADSGMTAADYAAAVKAGESAQIGSGAAAGAAEGAAGGTAAATMTPYDTAIMEAADVNELGAFAANPEVGLSAANTTGMDAPGVFEQISSFNLGDLAGKKKLFDMLGIDSSSYDALSSNSELVDFSTNTLSKDVNQPDLAQQRFDAFRAWDLSGMGPAAKLRGNQSLFQAQQANTAQTNWFNDPALFDSDLDKPQNYGGFSGGGSSLDY